MKTAASLFHQQLQSLGRLDLNLVENLVIVRCPTFFAGVLWTQTCMSSNFADFYVRSTTLRDFLEFHHQVTVRCLFSEPHG